MQVCNLTIREGLMVAGGFYGDLVVHNLHGSDNVTAYRCGLIAHPPTPTPHPLHLHPG